MKAGWFQQAKSVFGRPEPVPQSYTVSCDCGATLTGERTEAAQKPSCPACGQSVFVLPACSYPIPASLRRRWAGEEEPVLEPLPKKKPGKKPRKAKATEPSERRKSDSEKSASPKESRPNLTAEFRRHLTPVRLIALAVGMTVMLMGYVLYRQARFSRAQSTVQTSIDAGMEALKDRRFAEAAKSLTSASAALKLLGRRDDTTRSIHRLAEEATVAAELSDEGLPQMLGELFLAKDIDGMAKRFDRLYAGRWLLFDAPLFLVSDEGSKSASEAQLDLPLIVERLPVDVFVDDHRWQSLLSGSSAAEPKRMIFAAQLDRVDPPTKDRRGVRLYLRGETAVLWTERESLEALDLWPAGELEADPIDRLLSAQRDFVKGHE